MKILEHMCIFTATILAVSLFVPYAYGFNKQIELTTIKRIGGCQGIETEMIDGEEYARLLGASEDFMVDRFGQDSENWDTEDMKDFADIPNNPSSNIGKNQFFMTDEGEFVRSFDITKKEAKTKSQACYLSNLVADGFISYALKVDRDVRFCNSYPATIECGGGFYSNPNLRDDAEDSGDVKLIAESIHAMLQREPNQIVLKDIEDQLKKVGQSFTVLERSDIQDQLKNLNAELLDELVARKLTVAAQEKLATTEQHPFNTIESDYTYETLVMADTVFMIPNTIATYLPEFTDMLAGLGDLSEKALWVGVFSAVASIAGGVGASKLATSGWGYSARAAAAVEAGVASTRQMKHVNNVGHQIVKSANHARKTAKLGETPMVKLTLHGDTITTTADNAERIGTEMSKIGAEAGASTKGVLSGLKKTLGGAVLVDPAGAAALKSTINVGKASATSGKAFGTTDVAAGLGENLDTATKTTLNNLIETGTGGKDGFGNVISGTDAWNTVSTEAGYTAFKEAGIGANVKTITGMADKYPPTAAYADLDFNGALTAWKASPTVDNANVARGMANDMWRAGHMSLEEFQSLTRSFSNIQNTMEVLGADGYKIGNIIKNPGFANALESFDVRMLDSLTGIGSPAGRQAFTEGLKTFKHGGELAEQMKVSDFAVKYSQSQSMFMQSKWFQPGTGGWIHKTVAWGGRAVSRVITSRTIVGIYGVIVRGLQFGITLEKLIYSLIFVGMGGAEAQPFYTFRAFVFETGPHVVPVDRADLWDVDAYGRYGGSYAEIFQTSEDRHAGAHITKVAEFDRESNEFLPTMMSIMGFEPDKIFGETPESTALYSKSRDLGNLVAVVDQETDNPHLVRGKAVTNMITTNQGTDFYFLNINDYLTRGYFYEKPDQAYNLEGTSYNAMAFHIRNIDMKGLADKYQDGIDWIHIPFEEAAGKYKALSSIPTITTLPFISFMLPAARTTTIPIAMVWGVIKWEYFKEAWAPSVSDMLQEVREGEFGTVSSFSDSLRSDTFCRRKKDDAYKKVEEAVSTAETRIKRGMVVDIVSATVDIVTGILAMALLPTGIGTVISIAVGATFGMGAYIYNKYGVVPAQEDVMKAIEIGLTEMKGCKETEFEVFAMQAIPESEGATNEVVKSLGFGAGEEQAAMEVAGALADVADLIAPGTSEQIFENIQSTSAWQTMTLRSYINASRINIKGPSLFQVHFDHQANWKWALGPECPLEFCHQTIAPNGQTAYKCLKASGHVLYNQDGEVILTGPQTRFWQWDNLQGYTSIPQKIININQDYDCVEDVIMRIYPGRVEFTDKNLQKEMAGLIYPGKSYEEAKDTIETTLGTLEMIKTNNMWAYFTGETIVSRSLNDATGCGFGTDRHFENAYFEVYKNGAVKIVGEGGEDLGACTSLNVGSQEDFISFTEGKLISGYDDAGLKYTGMLHLAVYDIATEMNDAFTDLNLDWNGDTLGLELVPDEGFEDVADQMNALLEEMRMDYLQSLKNESITIDGDTFSYLDKDGNQIDYTITGTNADGCLELTGPKGEEVQFCPQMGPQGPEFAWKDKSGNEFRMPFILGWGVGQGGAVYNDGSSLSIKNEFPFAINPSFQLNGALATGSGGASPALPPWGGRTGTGTGTGVEPGVTEKNPLAALPWMPSGIEGILFILTAVFAVLAINLKWRKDE